MQFLVIGRQLRRPEHFTMAVFVEATPVETTEANAHLLKWTIIISFFFCFFLFFDPFHDPADAIFICWMHLCKSSAIV